jgi:GT2 family glycosyltransferase
LQACLEALAAQTMQEPWEVVVVDDGSPEPPVSSVESLVASLGWQLVRQPNAGPSAARNRGVREARGEFIAFTDDDCLPEPSWLSMLLQEARLRPHALVGGTTVNGLKGDFFAATSQLIVDFVYEHFNANPDDGYFLASNNILCSRAWFQEVGGFDESFPRAGGEDRDFCDRWRMRGWPITWQSAARVEHRHGQSFRQFVDLYIRYGLIVGLIGMALYTIIASEPFGVTTNPKWLGGKVLVYAIAIAGAQRHSTTKTCGSIWHKNAPVCLLIMDLSIIKLYNSNVNK